MKNQKQVYIMNLFVYLYVHLFFQHVVHFAHAEMPTEKDILESTKNHYPTIKESLFMLQSAKYNLTSAKGAFDAKLVSQSYSLPSGEMSRQLWDTRLEKPLRFANAKLAAGFGYGNYPTVMWNGPYSLNQTPQTGLPVRLVGSMSLLRGLAINENRAQLQTSRLSFDKAKSDNFFTQVVAKRDAILTYWSWVSALRAVEVYNNLLSMADKRREILQERARSGDISEMVVKENLQYLARRKADLSSAELNLVQTAQDLSLFYRSEAGIPILVETPKDVKYDALLLDKINTIDLNKSVTELPNRPDIYSLKKDIKINDINLSLARNNYLPKIDLSLEYMRNNNGGFGFFVDNNGNNPSEVWNIYLKVEIPIEYNLIDGQFKAAYAQKKMLDIKYNFLNENIKNDLVKLNEAKIKNKERMKNASDEFYYAKELLEAENYKFKKGASSFFLINIREEALAEAELKYVQSQFELIKAHEDYEVASTNYNH